jgi:hypothetical protein
VHLNPTDPIHLYETYSEGLCADWVRRGVSLVEAKKRLLQYICRILIRNNVNVPENWDELQELHLDPVTQDAAWADLPTPQADISVVAALQEHNSQQR